VSILSIVLLESEKSVSCKQEVGANSTFGDSYLKPSDIAGRLALHRSQVYKLIKDGTLPHIRIGRSVRVPAPAFEAYLRSLGATPRADAVPAHRGHADADAHGEVSSRVAGFQAATGRDPFAYLAAWKSGEIEDNAENAELAMDALALRAVLQHEWLAHLAEDEPVSNLSC
jgi:excisionase family DNA binding protein